MPTTPTPASNLWHDHHPRSRRNHLRQTSLQPGLAPRSESPPLPSSFVPKTGNPVIYVVAMTKDASGNYHQRLHALDATTGAELFKGPVNIRGPVSRHRRQQFRRLRHLRSRSIRRTRRPAPGQQHRLSLLVLALRRSPLHRMDHGLQRHHAGPDHRAQPDSQRQRGRASGAPAQAWPPTAVGNIILLDGNGIFDTTLTSSGFPSEGDYGNAFLRLTTKGGLAVADYFEMYNQVGGKRQ